MTQTFMNYNGKLKAELASLVEQSQSLTAILITKEGAAVCEAGDSSYLNTTALAALIAGMFSATREVARMVGENQFSILLQQGQKRHIHISLVTDSIMMVVIFDDYQFIGRVRHEAKKTSQQVFKLLTQQQDTKTEAEELSVPEFKEYALNLIDRIFVTR